LVAHTRLKTPTAVAEFLIKGMERFYDRMLEMENEIIRIARDLIDSREKELEAAASNLNYAVTGFINKNQTQLTKKGNELQRAVKQFSFQKQYEINNLRHHIKSTLLMWFTVSKTGIVIKRKNLRHVVKESLIRRKAELSNYKDLFKGRTEKMIFREQERIHFHENTARLIHPENVLKRGYTLTMKDGIILKSVKTIQLNEEIETRFADGNVKSKIVKKE